MSNPHFPTTRAPPHHLPPISERSARNKDIGTCSLRKCPTPKLRQAQCPVLCEEDVPLAVLAYKKGYVPIQEIRQLRCYLIYRNYRGLSPSPPTPPFSSTTSTVSSDDSSEISPNCIMQTLQPTTTCRPKPYQLKMHDTPTVTKNRHRWDIFRHMSFRSSTS